MAELPPEVILFEHEDFRGAHRHVFNKENDLAATKRGAAATNAAGGNFDGITSSIVVVRGTWEFFDAKDFKGHEDDLGPGAYPNFNNLPLGENISSLRAKT